jgi:penicillin amidase
MIVSLTDTTQAYGVYPGGQSGNPGSQYYDSFVDQWAAGKYYPLWVMKKADANDTRVKFKMNFSK